MDVFNYFEVEAPEKPAEYLIIDRLEPVSGKLDPDEFKILERFFFAIGACGMGTVSVVKTMMSRRDRQDGVLSVLLKMGSKESASKAACLLKNPKLTLSLSKSFSSVSKINVFEANKASCSVLDVRHAPLGNGIVLAASSSIILPFPGSPADNSIKLPYMADLLFSISGAYPDHLSLSPDGRTFRIVIDSMQGRQPFQDPWSLSLTSVREAVSPFHLSLKLAADLKLDGKELTPAAALAEMGLHPKGQDKNVWMVSQIKVGDDERMSLLVTAEVKVEEVIAKGRSIEGVTVGIETITPYGDVTANPFSDLLSQSQTITDGQWRGQVEQKEEEREFESSGDAV